MLFCSVKAAPPGWNHFAVFKSVLLFVNLEKEFGDRTRILSLKPFPSSRKDSIKLHSAYNAIPAWLWWKAFAVSVDVYVYRLSRCGPIFWKVIRVRFFPGCVGYSSPKASLSLAATSSPCKLD
jgi:hypothetical protein